MLGDDLTVVCNATVESVSPAGTRPTAQWTVNGAPSQQSFDALVLTTDMYSASKILDNGNNPLWRSLYAQYVGTNTGDTNSVWPLIPGYCYLHQDRSLLAPNLGAVGCGRRVHARVADAGAAGPGVGGHGRRRPARGAGAHVLARGGGTGEVGTRGAGTPILLRKGGGLIDAPGSRLVGAKGDSPL